MPPKYYNNTKLWLKNEKKQLVILHIWRPTFEAIVNVFVEEATA